MRGNSTRQGIAPRLIIYILLFSSFITFIATGAQLYINYSRDVNLIEQRVSQIRDSYLKSITSSLWALDGDQIQLQLAGIHRLPDMQYLGIEVNGSTFTSVGTLKKKNVITRQFPLIYKSNQQMVDLGTLHVVASLEGVYDRLRDTVLLILGTQAVKTFLVSTFVFLIFQYLVTRHLEEIAAYVRRSNVLDPRGILTLNRKPGLEGSQDELDAVVEAFNDMCTDLRKSYSALKKSEERFELAMRGANDGVWDWSIATDKVYYSPRWKSMLGCENNEIGGWLAEWQSRIHSDDRDETLMRLNQHLDGKSMQFESVHRLRHKDGGYRWILSRGLTVRGEDGKPYRMVGTHVDITDQKEAEEALERATDELQKEHRKRVEAERLACVGEISACIAHEIRNPLASIINSAALLEGRALPSTDKAEVVDIINSESRRLQRILDDFLDFARQRPPQLVKDNIISLLSQVIDSVWFHISNAGAVQRRINFHAKDCFALYDPDHIRQVSWNLILNAVQAMPDGGVLTVTTSRENDVVSIVIANTGGKFPTAILPKITEPFVSGRPNGTGLGLAIVQRILVQHQSELTIRNLEKEGAEVSFELKAA